MYASASNIYTCMIYFAYHVDDAVMRKEFSWGAFVATWEIQTTLVDDEVSQ